jgi:DNA processing protein
VSAAPSGEERAARVGLSRIVEPGSQSIYRAVAASGPVEVWQALRRGLACGGVSDQLRAGAAHRARDYEPEQDLRRLQRCDGRVIVPGDDEWPERQLTWDPDLMRDAPPLALYVRGPRRLDEAVERSVAIVGARAATQYGVHVAGTLALGVSDRGVAVVSGGAHGIDVAAHRGALASGRTPTVVVLACGVDVAYPRGHDRLLERLATEGLVVSELPPGCSPTRVRFLVRNRLIAALSLGTVVVEAARRSGSLATLDRAAKLTRVCMVVPGPVTSMMSAGCHERLRVPLGEQGHVDCVTSAADVLDSMGRIGDDAAEPERGPVHPRDDLAETARRVLDAVPVRVGAGEASIARAAGVSTLVVQQVLPPLQVHGFVERTSTGWRLTALGAGRPAKQSA